MRRRDGRGGRLAAIAALATATAAATVALGGGLAGADSFNPVRLAITDRPRGAPGSAARDHG